MSGRGDDKSIEPAHQPPLREVLRQPRIGEILTEYRVRRIAEEVAERLVADLEARVKGWAVKDDDAPRETGWAVVLDDRLPAVLIASRTWVAFAGSAAVYRARSRTRQGNAEGGGMTYTIRLNPGEAVQVSIWRRGNEVNLDVGEVVPVDVPPVEPPPADDHQRLQDLLTEVAALVAKLGSKA